MPVAEVIDVHAHCVPRPLLARLEREGTPLGVELVRSPAAVRIRLSADCVSAPVEELLLDAERRMERLDERGVRRQLLSCFIDIGAHHVPQGAAADYARMVNNALAELVGMHPDRLSGLATLPMSDPDAAAAELERTSGQLGFVGAQIGTADLDDPGLEPVWSAAARLRSIVMVHPDASTTSSLPFFLGNFIGNPAETTVAGGALILSGVLDRHPELVVVLVHGGGFLPYQAGRLSRGFAQYGPRFGARNTADPMRLLQRVYFDSILHDSAALEYLVRKVGAGRVLAGTDDPFAMGDADPAGTVARVPGLSSQERDLILFGNAERLLADVRETRR